MNPDEPDKLIKESKKVQELKAREDFYYDEIQKTLKELERIKNLKQQVPLDKARENYREQEFLNGIEGK